MRIILMLPLCMVLVLPAVADEAPVTENSKRNLLLFIEGRQHQALPAEFKTSADILSTYKKNRDVSWQEFKIGSGIHALFVWFDGDMPQVSRPHIFTINAYYHDGAQWRNAGFAFAPTGNLTVVRDLDEGSFSITDRIGKTHLVIKMKDLRLPKAETQSHDKVSWKTALTNPLPIRSRSGRVKRNRNPSRRWVPSSGWQALDVVRRAKRGASYRVRVPML